MTSPEVFRLRVAETGSGRTTNHSILKIPEKFTYSPGRAEHSSYYNIAMFDVSGSMHSVWPHVMDHWNAIIASDLTGVTDIYTFGAEVRFRRRGTRLEHGDFDSCSTNLAGALKRISKEIHFCSQSNVRIFLVTDGAHNCGGSPQREISHLHSPAGKTVEVYLLGIGYHFPVQYSVDIRSKLHNGSASCPTMFWARDLSNQGIMDEITKIADELRKGQIKVNLSRHGQVMPLIEETTSKACAGEYVYYETEPEELLSTLEVRTDDGRNITLGKDVTEATAEFLVSSLFKQWNAVLIQRYRNKERVPDSIFEFMKLTIDLQMKLESTNCSLKARIARKQISSIQLEFATLVNQTRKIINESRFQNEFQLAEAILKTSVQSRYDTRLFEIKGHGDPEWANDTNTFRDLYISMKSQIDTLPEQSPEDRCRVLMGSFIDDLKDPDFANVLSLNKIEFLNTLNFTGIPIYAPLKNSAQFNPWTLHIQNICVSPFEILSQQVLVSALEIGADSSANKEIRLQRDNEKSVCNAIVPIIPKEHCSILRKLVRTNVFSVGATFCILKNPVIVDHNCHLAALACVWMKTICDYPALNRPQFVKKRIVDVEETAKIYMDRPTIINYVTAMVTDPPRALVTESGLYDGRTLRCESIIKPAFFIHLSKDIIRQSGQETRLFQLILAEFLGRCLTSYGSKYPYMDFFVADNRDPRRPEILKSIYTRAMKEAGVTGSEIFEACYALGDVKKYINERSSLIIPSIIENETVFALQPQPNIEKVERLRHSGSAGHVSWKDLQAWAEEMAFANGDTEPLFSRELIEEAFSPKMLCTYLHQALQHPHSNDRMGTPLPDADAARAEIINKVKKEVGCFLKDTLMPALLVEAESLWRERYDAAHQAVALPLTCHEIIKRATEIGIYVNETNFHTIYKYRGDVQMCRNCCHVETCPHFLRPNKRFNCHIESERKWQNYPHTLHLVVSSYPEHSKKEITEKIKSRSEAGTNGRSQLPRMTSEGDVLTLQVQELKSKYFGHLVDIEWTEIQVQEED